MNSARAETHTNDNNHKEYMLRKDEGRGRVAIERVTPEIDGGRFPIKRIVGDTVHVEADAFTDGHDAISATLLYRQKGDNGLERSADGIHDQRPLAW